MACSITTQPVCVPSSHTAINVPGGGERKVLYTTWAQHVFCAADSRTAPRVRPYPGPNRNTHTQSWPRQLTYYMIANMMQTTPVQAQKTRPKWPSK